MTSMPSVKVSMQSTKTVVKSSCMTALAPSAAKPSRQNNRTREEWGRGGVEGYRARWHERAWRACKTILQQGRRNPIASPPDSRASRDVVAIVCPALLCGRPEGSILNNTRYQLQQRQGRAVPDQASSHKIRNMATTHKKSWTVGPTLHLVPHQRH